jgi:hypothetical protein
MGLHFFLYFEYTPRLRHPAALVSDDFFEVIGVQPARGRNLSKNNWAASAKWFSAMRYGSAVSRRPNIVKVRESP